MRKGALTAAFTSGFALAWALLGSWAPETIGTPAQAETGETPFEARLDAAFREIETQNLSAIVGISHGGSEVLREFGGLATDGILPEASQIDINSITKTVTGVMVAKLVEQGRLRFDEPLKDIFSDVPQDKADITIHQLLTHSSGFPESLGNDYEPLTRDAFLARAWATDLLSPPGSVYLYSNAGYSVLAAAIELRTGKSYDAYLREEVLPEGFANTGYDAVYQPGQSMRTSDGLAIWQASWGDHEPYWNLIGNGGLVSTVPETIALRKAFREGRIVPAELVDLVQHPHIDEGGGASFYGYGLVVLDVPELGRIYWHDGGNDVFSAHWIDMADTADILFTAGQGEAAFDAMSILMRHLYDFDG
ncbi:serine hydrolase domain-containing protein [Tabrizicola sp.]|uniref:serine hydrolase domain-containing protein n=1 Tax=Tabrizicola sp. TaxID=2005166 RepID=UPI003F2FF724